MAKKMNDMVEVSREIRMQVPIEFRKHAKKMLEHYATYLYQEWENEHVRELFCDSGIPSKALDALEDAGIGLSFGMDVRMEDYSSK